MVRAEDSKYNNTIQERTAKVENYKTVNLTSVTGKNIDIDY